MHGNRLLTLRFGKGRPVKPGDILKLLIEQTEIALANDAQHYPHPQH